MKKLEEAERLQKEQELENMTPEQKLAEKLRIQKLQEESDLKTALETFGVTALPSGIDAMNPDTKEDFLEFADALSKKIASFKLHAEYMNFLEDLTNKLLAPCKFDHPKAISMNESIYSQK
jgi:translation initiation factor 3 subunit J